MADKTAIQWTDATWNPVAGCSVVSPGCTNCYAMKQAHSLERRFGSRKYAGLTKVVNGHPVWTGEIRLDEAALPQPLRWKKPRRIFVNSMSDLFHENLPDDAIDRVFAVMALAPQHIFQMLTKRAERMRGYFGRRDLAEAWWEAGDRMACEIDLPEGPGEPYLNAGKGATPIPLPNVWLGVSVEDQQRAEERIPHLLATPAAKRFISAEPLIGPIDLGPSLYGHEDNGVDMSRPVGQRVGACTGYTPPLEWVIVGGESGKDARPFNLDWGWSLVAQCRSAGVACFVKQLGSNPQLNGFTGTINDRKGGDWSEWPEDLRVREFPA